MRKNRICFISDFEKSCFIKIICISLSVFMFLNYSRDLVYANIFSSISGKVIDRDTSQGVKGIYVIALGEQKDKNGKFQTYGSQITGDDGNYILDGIPPGAFKLSLITETEYFQVSKNAINVMEGMNVNGANIMLSQGGILSGKILRHDNTMPAEGVLITVNTEFDIKSKLLNNEVII